MSTPRFNDPGWQELDQLLLGSAPQETAEAKSERHQQVVALLQARPKLGKIRPSVLDEKTGVPRPPHPPALCRLVLQENASVDVIKQVFAIDECRSALVQCLNNNNNSWMHIIQLNHHRAVAFFLAEQLSKIYSWNSCASLNKLLDAERTCQNDDDNNDCCLSSDDWFHLQKMELEGCYFDGDTVVDPDQAQAAARIGRLLVAATGRFLDYFCTYFDQHYRQFSQRVLLPRAWVVSELQQVQGGLLKIIGLIRRLDVELHQWTLETWTALLQGIANWDYEFNLRHFSITAPLSLLNGSAEEFSKALGVLVGDKLKNIQVDVIAGDSKNSMSSSSKDSSRFVNAIVKACQKRSLDSLTLSNVELANTNNSGVEMIEKLLAMDIELLELTQVRVATSNDDRAAAVGSVMEIPVSKKKLLPRAAATASGTERSKYQVRVLSVGEGCRLPEKLWNQIGQAYMDAPALPAKQGLGKRKLGLSNDSSDEDSD